MLKFLQKKFLDTFSKNFINYSIFKNARFSIAFYSHIVPHLSKSIIKLLENPLSYNLSVFILYKKIN